MTNRLTPVGSWRGAEASARGAGVFIKIVHDGFISDVAADCRKIALAQKRSAQRLDGP